MTDHEIYVLDSALNYIKHVGANHTMRGKPHPQQWIVDGLEALLVSARRAARPEVATLAKDAVHEYRTMIQELHGAPHYLMGRDEVDKLACAMQTAYRSPVQQEEIAIQRALAKREPQGQP